MTVRLDERQADELDAVARVDEMPVAQAVRTAIDAHIDARRKDKHFRERLDRMMSEHRKILERLAQ